jgi:threonine dehydratase
MTSSQAVMPSPAPAQPIDRSAIQAAAARIRPHIRVTPILELAAADLGMVGFDVVLKLEQLQRAGSFKTRGAFANLLLRDIPEAGVVAASGGSHGVAVAFAARSLGIRATIFVPTIASPAKIQRIRSYGADLVIGGDRYDDALEASLRWARSSGALAVHAFDQHETLLGQATLALELSQQVPTLETLVVPVGGGGLIGGIASWYGDAIRLVGVEPEAAPTLTNALSAGRPVDAPTGSIAADSLAPRRVGELTFPIARLYVDRVIRVTDDQISEAQDRLWDSARVATEPGGAAAFAALSSGQYVPRPSERVGVVISGANITLESR